MTYQPKIYRKQGGDALVVTTSGYIQFPVQTVSSSATTITASGASLVTGTTVGPTYLISNPITGVLKHIALAGASSGATHRAIIAPASTGVAFDTTGQNNITLATSALRGVTLIGLSTAAWAVVGTHVVATAGLGNVAT